MTARQALAALAVALLVNTPANSQDDADLDFLTDEPSANDSSSNGKSTERGGSTSELKRSDSKPRGSNPAPDRADNNAPAATAKKPGDATSASDLDSLIGDSETFAPNETAAQDKSGDSASSEAPAQASGTNEAPADAAPKHKGRVIEEIVVTAQKTEQSLQDVPLSVSAISGELIREAAIIDPAVMVQYTPNIKISPAAVRYFTVTIRGFGTPPYGRGVEPSVGLVIDDTFYGRTTFINDGAFDIERLEVLRGPQGTLFGKNTIAGLMNFTTAEPSFDTRGYLNLAGGSLNSRRLEAGFGFPLIEDKLAARVAFRARASDAGVYNTKRDETTKSDDIQARIKLRWLLSDSLALNLSVFKSSADLRGSTLQYSNITPRNKPFLQAADPKVEDNEFDGHTSASAPAFEKRDSNSTTLKLTKSLDSFGLIDGLEMNVIANTAEIKTPYAADSDFGPIDFARSGTDGPEVYKQKSLEMRFTGATPAPFKMGQSMDWITGLYAFDTDFDVSLIAHQNLNALLEFLPITINSRIPAQGQPLVDFLAARGLTAPVAQVLGTGGMLPNDRSEVKILNLLHSSGQTYAAFAQTTWHFTDRLDAVLGARIGLEKREGESSSENYGSPLGTIFARQQNFHFSGDRRETEFSPKVALNYKVTDGFSVFGNITKGFKSGGFSGPILAPRNEEYDPERAVSTEMGFKSRLFEDSLMLNMTLYKVDFDALQLTIFDGTSISTINAAAATSKGMEMDFQWLPPIEFLSLQGSAGFTHARYGKFPCGPGRYNDRPKDGCGMDDPTTPQDERAPAQDLTGRELAFVPRMSASLTPMVKLPIWPSRGIGGFLALDVLYQGAQYLDYDLDEHTYQRATTKLNLRLGARPISGGPWSVVFNAKNLTQQKEKLLVLDSQQGGGDFVAIVIPDEPQYSLDLRWEFGGQ